MKTPSSSFPLIVCAALAFAAAALGLIALFLSVPLLGIAAAAVTATEGIVLLLLCRKAAPAQESPAAPCAAAAPTLGDEGERCCPYCGETLSDAALFCPACGAEQPWHLGKV